MQFDIISKQMTGYNIHKSLKKRIGKSKELKNFLLLLLLKSVIRQKKFFDILLTQKDIPFNSI
jgi:hypothetical protein